ncbi:MAG: arylsulfatase [Roseibacillus sp.]
MKTVLAMLLIGGLASFAFGGTQPNVIVVLTDDQGYGDLGRHGHPFLKTPHLDKFHDESVRFNNFYVSPSCSPTRAALLTGRHEFRSGVTHTIQGRERLSTEAVTLPQLLKTAGYRTGFVGKWHLGNDPEHRPAARGFEWTSTNAGGPRVHFDPVMIRNGKKSKREGFREDVFFDEAMTFMEESGENPFFCYLATYSPHTPLDAPEEDIARYREHVSEKDASYLAMIDNIDQNMGRLMAFLKKSGLEENTIVVFMNDNGVTEGLDVFNAGMRGCKCTIWEGGSRAMSFWRWPNEWKPHTVDNLTAHLDVLPTICELAGVEVPKELEEKLEGFDLLPLLETTEPVSWYDDRLLFHHVARWPSGLAESHKYAMCGVRQGHQLLLRSHPCEDPACEPHSSQCKTLRLVGKGRTGMTYTKKNAQYHWGVSEPGRWSLFDVKKDLGCEHDLALESSEKVSELAQAYEQWWEDVFPEMIAAGGDGVAVEKSKEKK